MKCYDVVGYTYEADVHCIDCARKRFGRRLDVDGLLEDGEGKLVNVIFAGGEYPDDWCCGDCGEALT